MPTVTNLVVVLSGGTVRGASLSHLKKKKIYSLSLELEIGGL